MPPVTLKPSTTSSLDLDTVRTTRRDEDSLLGRVGYGGRLRPIRVAVAHLYSEPAARAGLPRRPMRRSAGASNPLARGAGKGRRGGERA